MTNLKTAPTDRQKPGWWRSAVLYEDAQIEQAIRNLEETGYQIVLVTDSAGKFLGTLTDGDIRRGMLAGLALNTPIKQMINPKPLIAPVEVSRETVLHIMHANKIHQIPVVDSNGQLVGLHIWSSVISTNQRTNTLVIMAGGMGKRLRPYTDSCPKPMLRVAGKPMLEHIIERAKLNGFSNFIISVNYLAEVITNYFGNGRQFNVSINYVHETEPLGTGGSLSLIDPIPNDPIVITNGDVLTHVNYAEILDFHLNNQSVATMAVRNFEWQHPFGVVNTNGADIIGIDEKPTSRTLVNAGIYVLSPQAVAQLQPQTYCDMPSLFQKLMANNHKTIVFPMHEPWIDVGREADYLVAAEQFKIT
jgi:dTDP-glucose pyrophosphorylase